MAGKLNNKVKKIIPSGINIKAFIAADIPSALNRKYLGHLAVGLLMVIIGFGFMIAFRSISGGFFPLILGLVLVIMGVAYKASILRGYKVVEGTVIERTKLLPGFKSTTADGFTLLTDDNNQIHVPATKRKNSIAIGTKLRVYLSRTSSAYDNKNGVTSYGNILGYEIIGINSVE